jgi:hypothetical protein
MKVHFYIETKNLNILLEYINSTSVELEELVSSKTYKTILWKNMPSHAWIIVSILPDDFIRLNDFGILEGFIEF